MPQPFTASQLSDSFSTDLVPVAERRDAWLSNAKQICGDCRFHFPKRVEFYGSIERRVLGRSAFTSFSSTPISFVKFPSVPANSAERDSIVLAQLEGTQRYCQSNTIAMLAPGDTTIVDTGQPWTSDCDQTSGRLYLRLPRWLLQDRLKLASLPVLPRILGKHGLGATLFQFATSLYSHAEEMTIEEGMIAMESYLKILAGCLDHRQAFCTKLDRCAQLLPRVEHYIESQLAERTLNPTEIAAMAGISVRHLYRLFAAKGWTVTKWIRERRLDHCRSDLVDPGLADWSITDIAFRWGFSDSAHFSHCFHHAFGVSPRQLRREALECTRTSRIQKRLH